MRERQKIGIVRQQHKRAHSLKCTIFLLFMPFSIFFCSPQRLLLNKCCRMEHEIVFYGARMFLSFHHHKPATQQWIEQYKNARPVAFIKKYSFIISK
jgi:hypothetical protein